MKRDVQKKKNNGQKYLRNCAQKFKNYFSQVIK